MHRYAQAQEWASWSVLRRDGALQPIREGGARTPRAVPPRRHKKIRGGGEACALSIEGRHEAPISNLVLGKDVALHDHAKALDGSLNCHGRAVEPELVVSLRDVDAHILEVGAPSHRVG